jgi:ligand-binding sensor domain-containing protein/signal transduction histidine kinase
VGAMEKAPGRRNVAAPHGRARGVIALCGHRRGQALALGLVLAGILLVSCPRALALDPSLDVSQYAHTAWRVRDGFAKGEINAITQTPDGYLWLGTDFGLLRFDGVRAVPWQPPPGQSLPSNDIRSLAATRDGTLWIGTDKGLASWGGGKLTSYQELAGQVVLKLLEDHKGTLWAGGLGVPSGKLCAIQKAGVRCYGENGTLGPGVFGLYEDGMGCLWVGVIDGLWRWNPGTPRFYPLADEPNGIQALGEDADGTLLVVWHGGIHRFVDGKTEAYPVIGTAQKVRAAANLLRDRNGGMWIGTLQRGLLHVGQGRLDEFSLPDGLSGDAVGALYQDREDSIWVATFTGLDRFRDFAVATYSVKQGLSSTLVNSVLTARDGSVWISTLGGLNRSENGRVAIPYTGGAKRSGKLNGQNARSLFQDDRGRIWTSTSREFGYLENNRFISVSGIPGGMVHDIAKDAKGNLWIANQELGLFRLSAREEIKRFPWAELGHKDYAVALAPDRTHGGLWIGFFRGGIAYFADGKIRASYGAPNGLGHGAVNRIRLDPDGTVWAATEGGLSRLKNGRIATLSSKNGLPCDNVHWAMEDDNRSLWLYVPCGLAHVSSQDIDAWAAAADRNEYPKQTVRPTVFDSLDGVQSLADAAGYSPMVTRSSDGKLWFVSVGSVSVLDPRHIPFNKLPPPVHVEQITADRKTYGVAFDANGDAKGHLRLPPLLRDLEIDYTALSLVAPEKVRFRYRLEGWDLDWQDVGNRRQAFYSNLSPGDYRFRVAASNNSGVWNEADASFAFSIAPAYYQTTWFRLSCVVAFLAMLWALYQLRLRQAMHRVQHHMQGRLVERERIARELHDTLLQSVQGLILKFDAVAKQIPRDEPARLAMDEALDRADEVMGEGRERVRSLRAGASALSDLPAAFQRVADETAPGREATFKTIVEGSVRELNPMVLEESYSIGREALINALAHSGGLHVEVEIMYDPREFRLRIRDDGRGVDPRILENGGRPGHWGMQGMRERAQGMGAQLGLWSRPGSGTEVELLVPAGTAYRSGRAPAKTSWLGRHFGNGR